MQPPKIDNSTKEERLAYVLEAWKCLHDCEACGKCRILKGRDAEVLYADYIEGKRSYMDITLEIRNRSVRKQCDWVHVCQPRLSSIKCVFLGNNYIIAYFFVSFIR